MCMLTSHRNPGLNKGREHVWLGALRAPKVPSPSCSVWQLLARTAELSWQVSWQHNSEWKQENNGCQSECPISSPPRTLCAHLPPSASFTHTPLCWVPESCPMHPQGFPHTASKLLSPQTAVTCHLLLNLLGALHKHRPNWSLSGREAPSSSREAQEELACCPREAQEGLWTN